MSTPASQPSDPPRRTVSLGSGHAAYTDEGRGPVIVAVHGLPGSARDFRHLAPHLARCARVIRIDLPGFGETPAATEPDPSPEGRARFVLSTIDALDLEPPTLLGHSMGGVVACAAAVAAPPGRLARLALLSSPGLRPHTMLRRLPFRTMNTLLSLPLLGPALTPALRALFRSSGFRGYPDGELLRTITCVTHTSIARHADNVRRVALPTLVAWCEDDPLIERDIAHELAAALPDGPRLRFSNGGHNPQKSQAAPIAETLCGWLATSS